VLVSFLFDTGEGAMATASRVKYNEIFEMFSCFSKFCLFIVKGFALIMITIVGMVVLLVICFNIFLITSSLVRFIGF
jgi:hypothetical protein